MRGHLIFQFDIVCPIHMYYWNIQTRNGIYLINETRESF